MSRPEFGLCRFLDSSSDRDCYIARDEIESNAKNLGIHLDYQKIKINRHESIYILSGKHDKRKINQLKTISKNVLSEESETLEKDIAEIESNFDFDILEKTYNFGYAEFQKNSVSSVSFFPNATNKEKKRSNLKSINYHFSTEIEGFYEETVSLGYDLMSDEFFSQNIPHCILIKQDVERLESFVKPDYQEIFQIQFIDQFIEGRCYFYWDY